MNSESKNIIIVLPFFTLGGAETQALYIAKAFVQKNHKVTVVAFEEKNNQLIEKLNEIGVSSELINLNLSLIHANGLGKIKILFRYLLFLRGLKPDYIFPLTYYPNVLSSAVWRFTGAKYCFWNQRGMESLSLNFIEKIARFMKPKYLANSKSCENFITERHSLVKGELQVIPNAIQGKAEKIQGMSRDVLGINATDRIYLSVANFFPEKNHEELIKSWSEFEKERGDKLAEVLILVGYFPSLENERRIKATLFDYSCKNIIILPPQKDIKPLYQMADFGILASYSEGCPNVLLEYMLNELIVISSKIDSTIEILGENYLLFFNVGQHLELSNILLKSVKDDFNDLKRENKVIVEKKYTFGNLAKKYLKLING